MIVVCDTFPISALILIDHIHLLHDLYGDVLAPEAVAVELVRLHPSLPPWIKIEPVVDRVAVDRLKEKLGVGESEAIILSEENRADLLLTVC